MIGDDGHGIVWCAAAFLAGNALGRLLAPPQILIAIPPLILALASFRNAPTTRWAAILLSFLLLGAAAPNPARSRPSATHGLRYTADAVSVTCILERNLENCGEAEMGVIRALSLGDKSGLTRDVKANFRASGATHLLALSGLHVGIIYKLIGWMFAILGGAPWAKRLRSIATLAFLWWFAIITGLSPSIFRAVLMITIYEAGQLIGRRSNGLNSLAASAIIITLLNPEAPAELSFQMSFCACLSIFTIYPRLNAMMQTGIKPIQYIWDCATLAISCQMTTGIIAWAKFGTFPKYFIITNLLTVPLVAAIMYLIVLTIITSGLPQTGPVIAHILIKATELLNLITETIASL